MMRIVSFALLVLPALLHAQVDLPVFGTQQVINGYAKDVEGEVLSYFSVYPEHATTALLTRCNDGKKAIAWETAVVPHYPHEEEIPYYYFSWIAAHNSTTSGGDRSFDLYVNDTKALTFITHHSNAPGSWEADGTEGTKLAFEFSKKDRHGDAHGFAHLRVPRKFITPGKSLRLKVVGHAQESPDWFMTFRYTFEEKVEVEVLPFVRKDDKQVLLITLMHFGADDLLTASVNGRLPAKGFVVKNGLNVFKLPIDTVTANTSITVRSVIARRIDNPRPPVLDVETTLVVQPVIHRDIHLIHHSHTDIGYSHLQAEVEAIQNNNIWKALELIDRTKDYPKDSRFVWNVESLWAVENFLGIASETDKQRFIAAVKSGSIALSANYANILTGLCTPEEMHWIVEYADSLRKWYDLPITSAMQTDIPGMSWSMVDAYAAHGIRYLSQGPNYIPDMPDGGDRIGSTLREQGDKPYWWKGTTGRDSILVWTAGQGYGGWHGYTAGAIQERGTRKIAAYMNELDANRYPYRMVQWRYNIVSDNGPVDSTLSDFVREWNETYASPRLIISNVGDMMAEFDREYGKRIPTWSGDFTPYWEDGAYSTAKEEGDVRVLSARLSNLIDAAKILNKPINPHLLYRAKRSIVMWHEHTWGAWCSISDPDAHFTTDQWRVKKAFADSAGWYVEAIASTLSPNFGLADSICVLNTLNWEIEHIPPTKGIWLTNKQQLMWDKKIHYKPNSSFHRSEENSLVICDRVSDSVPDPFCFEINWNHTKGIDSDQIANTSIAPSTININRHQRSNGCWVLPNRDSIEVVSRYRAPSSTWHLWFLVHNQPSTDKESLHLALPFDIPNATVRIGISDTCVTP